MKAEEAKNIADLKNEETTMATVFEAIRKAAHEGKYLVTVAGLGNGPTCQLLGLGYRVTHMHKTTSVDSIFLKGKAETTTVFWS